ncbi:MAG: hypothetical protein H7Z74_01760 [Anaerolineae bacterium]|nr:hypothetical protein [Gemmatimonadaceae bacterium]
MFASARDSQGEVLVGPIRGELLGAERLAEHARRVARAQLVGPRVRESQAAPLLARLKQTRRILTSARDRLSDAAERSADISPAGEWLLDNFYVLEEHILEVHESMPRGYYRELPELLEGSLSGHPRVYEVAIELIAHTEGRIDLENVELFVREFQRVLPLKIGELWAVPAMLRLGLIESVRRMALRTVQRLDQVEEADRWAGRIQAASADETHVLGGVLSEFVNGHPPLTPIFVTRFLQQLRTTQAEFTPLVWVEQWMAEDGMSAGEAAARSGERLALTQLIMANSITSLRAISRMDWRSFVERQSALEAVLRKDPSGYYLQMTFGTRDHYRHVAEWIARRTDIAEEDVAQQAIELATTAARERPDDLRLSHVGYYLVGDGLVELERATRYRPKLKEAVHRWVLRHADFVFVGGISLGTLAMLVVLLWLAGPDVGNALFAVLLLGLIPANEIAISIVNQLVAAFLPPRILPKLEMREYGVPEAFRTAVVVPTLFGNVEAVREALEHLEVQFLANREAHLHFAVLSDFTDSPTETREGDTAIVEAAVDGVQALNDRYAGGAQDAFFLFHRPRRWNPQQGVWMGWERKRGKLAQFNGFVRGRDDGAFSTIVGDVATVRRVRFVITLDSDTVLPPDAAPLLVGAAAHPLNRASYDPAVGRVVSGYGILQPRVGVSLPSAHRSRFASIHSGHPGVDPYTTAISDVYQDLFAEGSFTGKGIYDVEIFEQATHGRFPENTLLSHDLIEGSYARAGLLTDVELYDDYPTRYLTYTRRKHRWIRGDWQLLKWLTSSVPGPDGPERNRLSLLSRWKIFDNLRRSTVEVAQLLLLVAGWTVLPGSPLRWTGITLAAVAAPWVISLLLAMVRPPLDKSWRAYYSAVWRDAATSAHQVALTVAFLPHQAWVSVDAIARTLWRLFVSRRFLLQWQTASQVERAALSGAREAWRVMWPAVVVALAACGTVAAAAAAPNEQSTPLPWQLVGYLPIIGLWLVSPAIAHALSDPSMRRERRLAPPRRADAMRYAILHWRYFERFVTEETNWLVPDNFQEEPVPVVAMRTSPTNIGLQLLATVSAYDLGFITVEGVTERLELAFRSLERMRRFRGHFYNWYDLHDLRVLEPKYVSTVDSGNLAGHLLALRQACLAIPDDRMPNARIWHAVEAAMAAADGTLRDVLAKSGATAEQRRSAESVTEKIRAVRAEIASAGRVESLGISIDSVMTNLTASLVEVDRMVFRDEQVDMARGWITWAIDLVVTHDEKLASTEPGLTLRERAAQVTAASEQVARLDALANRAYEYATEMDFRFLFDNKRELFSIGYHQTSHTLDSSYYDLLASEARLASFIAIAKNDVPVDHWFRLGRSLTHASGETALVSWSGSMFEYLMPLLVMQSYPSTLLDQTYEGAVRRHAAYCSERDVPWGISESAYNVRDRFQTYQYRAFGVPDLALKRGLSRDLVVAPYASVLAVMVDATFALANLHSLERLGALGAYGFRDAIDYTRPDAGLGHSVVCTYMAHHIGMSFVALTNALTGQQWKRRFHADPLVRSVELLLHERIPRRLVLQRAQGAHPEEALPDPELERPAVREFETPDTPEPRIALLGHLPYTIMVSHCGGGYSRYENLAVTRWRADGTRDNTGQFFYVKDVSQSRVWSAAHQPVCATADWYRALLATDRVTFHRRDGDIETRTEIAIVPEDLAEVRRITLTNNSDEPREIELTSYGEIVLAPPDADRAHPAFANLFVETEYHAWASAITATRRPRSSHEQRLWCVHVVATGKEAVGEISCETDRDRFIGRGRSTREPAAVEREGALSGTTGAVLDPIFALRTRVRIARGQTATVSFTTLVANSRERAFELADRYNDSHTAQRAFDLAWTAAQVELRELGVPPADAAVFQDLAGHLFYPNPALRAEQQEMRENHGAQTLLWSQGISGDWPILLATIESAEGLPTVRQLLVAHQYLRRRGMMVDLLLLNEHPPTYLEALAEQITAMLLASSEAGVIDRPGGVFVRRGDFLSKEELLMLRSTARVLVQCDGRPLGRILGDDTTAAIRDALAGRKEAARILAGNGRRLELAEHRRREAAGEAFWESGKREAGVGNRQSGRANRESGIGNREKEGRKKDGAREAQRNATKPLNGFGGLTEDGDYEIQLARESVTPAPWANVVANERGGFVVTERGGGFSWAENSYFYRLTPWHNDPVSDPVSEVLYLRDERTRELWSATPAPIRHTSPYTIRHGAGWSSFQHEHDAVATHLTLGVPREDSVKISVLKVTNSGSTPRRLSVTAYAEWALGAMREHTQHQVRTEFDRERNAVLAQNYFDAQFAHLVAFCAISEPVTSYTADRREFLGRNGSPDEPAAFQGSGLSRTTGAGIDPCAALQCVLELAPGESRDIVVLLGAACGHEEARKIIARYANASSARQALQQAGEAWVDRLSVVAVQTPDPAFDAMLNRWTLYQALACRMWARSALYQSSGAYGFRDQLQDTMAFVYAEPAIAREHILRSAARQFVEGDVQHWWHPQSGRGVRTRFSDDLVWLPYVLDHYVRVTGDSGVLDESVPFLEMRPLEPHEHEVYDLPRVSAEHASVYDHCLRALRKACTAGVHGLPLIGGGDWNDGMNRVGVGGQGESVWLAWFLIKTLRAFAEHSEKRGDTAAAEEFRSRAQTYSASTEEHGWDGSWYKRAYYDDGTPLGSAENSECRIDSLAQSWSVISGAGDPERQARAMRSMNEHLVRDDARLIALLTPAFNDTTHDPGYIKGYLPGVRENGAQYTHAALWAALGTAMLGDGDRAFALYQMLNPLTHSRTEQDVETYKTEPYVIAADVYSVGRQLGRGGWTWYTGSASWMYRVGLEAILGFTKIGETLAIDPCIPRHWQEFTLRYRYGRSEYLIRVVNPDNVSRGLGAVTLDGVPLEGRAIPLLDDGRPHEVLVSLEGENVGTNTQP